MNEETVWLVAGLGYGDEGKGSIVDYLVRREKARVVVRYNGGAQAGHRVVLSDGREHIFSQFGSGTLTPQVATHLSRFMLVEPMGMMREHEHLESLGCYDAFRRTTIDEKAPIITPFHIAANRLLELKRGKERHGSCGLGIGETVEDLSELGSGTLIAGDLADIPTLRRKLSLIRERKLSKVKQVLSKVPASESFEQNLRVLEDLEAIDWCIERYSEFMRHARIVDGEYLGLLLEQGTAVFEGAQGMLLDPHYGSYPHVTKTDITYKNALILLDKAGYSGSVTRVGVIRGYFTRHGEGPFPTEEEKLSVILPDERNKDHKWQGKFRVGYFDVVQALYSLEALGGIDELAITNLDRLIDLPELKICIGYDPELKPIYEELDPIDARYQAHSYADMLAEHLGHAAPILSFGPTADDKSSLAIASAKPG